MRLDVFKFKSMRDLLQAAYRTPGINRRRALTLPAIAMRLGYTSPRTVAMVLKGQRAPSSDLVNRVAKDLHLGMRERTMVTPTSVNPRFPKLAVGPFAREPYEIVNAATRLPIKAGDVCGGFRYAGFVDWRLPTAAEIQELADLDVSHVRAPNGADLMDIKHPPYGSHDFAIYLIANPSVSNMYVWLRDGFASIPDFRDFDVNYYCVRK